MDVDYKILEQTIPRVPEGAYVGACGDTPIVAGGHDRSGGFLSEVKYQKGSSWQTFALHVPRGDGGSVCTEQGLLLIGGSTLRGPSPEVIRLRPQGGGLVEESLPSLPVGLVMPGACVYHQKLRNHPGFSQLAAVQGVSIRHSMACALPSPALYE